MPLGGPDTRRAEPGAQVGLWQSEEVGAIEPQRHEPKVDPNSAETRTCRGSSSWPMKGSEMDAVQQLWCGRSGP